MELCQRWAVLTHGDMPDPRKIAGTILDAGAQYGIAFDIFTMEDVLPDVRSIDGLVVMGGLMGVYDRVHIPRLDDEATLMHQATIAGKWVLGICLGAQLLAHALGARVLRGPVFEFGPVWIERTAAGMADPILGSAASQSCLIQAHHDTFDLPDGAVHLARSTTYTNQAFRAGDRAYGFQFHPEVSDSVFAQWWHGRYPDGDDYPVDSVGRASADGRDLIHRYFRVAAAEMASERRLSRVIR